MRLWPVCKRELEIMENNLAIRISAANEKYEDELVINKIRK